MNRYTKLIGLVTKQRLCSIEIKAHDPLKMSEDNQLVTVKKQLGNFDGSIIEIDLFNGADVLDIRYKRGGYSGVRSIQCAINELMEVIIDGMKK